MKSLLNNFTPLLHGFLFYWRGLIEALYEMPKWERGLHIFWLLGPIILLIERSPADIWISICALSFVFRSLSIRDFSWCKIFWVRACFLFLGVCSLSSLFSVISLHSLSEAIVWFRFPLFAMATTFWFAKDKRLLYGMLFSTAFGVLLMTGILTAELIVEGQRGERLSWPYGDFVPGNYLAKVGMPVFVIAVAIAVGIEQKYRETCATFVAVSIIISIFTGERINFLLRICSGMLAGLFWRPHRRRFLWLVAVEVAAVITTVLLAPNLFQRFVVNFFNHLPFGPHSDYYRVIGAGIEVFKSAPVFGVGPASHRELCKGILTNIRDYRCDNHPHNFFVQLLAEVGILGFAAGSLMIFSIAYSAHAGYRSNKANVVASTAFVIPLALFFPIQTTGDFFGQWNNIFMWSAIALSLASASTLATEKA